MLKWVASKTCASDWRRVSAFCSRGFDVTSPSQADPESTHPSSTRYCPPSRPEPPGELKFHNSRQKLGPDRPMFAKLAPRLTSMGEDWTEFDKVGPRSGPRFHAPETPVGRRSAAALGHRMRAAVANHGLRLRSVGTPRCHIRVSIVIVQHMPRLKHKRR